VYLLFIVTCGSGEKQNMS